MTPAVLAIIGAAGVALLVRLAANELSNRSSARRSTGIDQPHWPWVAAFVIFCGTAIGFASAVEDSSLYKLLAAGVFLLVTTSLLVWAVTRKGKA